MHDAEQVMTWILIYFTTMHHNPLNLLGFIQSWTAGLDALMGTSKNSEFAQIQGVGKILPRHIYLICKQEIAAKFFPRLVFGRTLNF
ncbi:MAG: hypothetical protein HY016_02260 [Nitrosomonadales bacterium]|nr:hypothetical protein [Nitrosomonadales bacterium]